MDLSDLTIPVAIFKGKDDKQPAAHTLSWDALATRLCQFDQREIKDGRAWSPVTYRPGTTRGRENVEQVHALALDIDHSTEGLPLDLLDGREFAAHTTFQHTPEAPRWRVVLPLTRAISGADWPEFWLRANTFFGGCVDPATKDSSRLFYLPSCPPGALHETRVQHGRLLDPDELPEVPRFEQPVAPHRNGTIHAVAGDGLVGWAARFASAKLDELGRMSPNTGRNAACNRLAYLLGGLVADGRHDLDEAWVSDQLFSACISNGLVHEDGERSVRNTIASGLSAGLARAWSPADQDGTYEPAPRLRVVGDSTALSVVPGQSIDKITGEVTGSAWQTLGDLLRATPDTQAEVLEGLIRTGRTHWVYSAPGVGKTIFILAALMHVAAGVSFCGRAVKQCPIIFIEEDSPFSVISDYVGMLADIYGFDLDTLPFWINRQQGFRLDSLSSTNSIMDAFTLAPQWPGVVVIDACERVIPSDKFSSKELEPLSTLLQKLSAMNVASVIIDHTRKTNASTQDSDPLDLLYGGRTKSAISDIMIHFSGKINQSARVKFTKFRGLAPGEFDVTFDDASGFTIKTQRRDMTDNERQVMRSLNSIPGQWLTKDELEEGTGIADRTLKRVLAALMVDRFIERGESQRPALFRAITSGVSFTG